MSQFYSRWSAGWFVYLLKFLGPVVMFCGYINNDIGISAWHDLLLPGRVKLYCFEKGSKAYCRKIEIYFRIILDHLNRFVICKTKYTDQCFFFFFCLFVLFVCFIFVWRKSYLRFSKYAWFQLYCFCQYIDEVDEENWQNMLINIHFCQYFACMIHNFSSVSRRPGTNVRQMNYTDVAK